MKYIEKVDEIRIYDDGAGKAQLWDSHDVLYKLYIDRQLSSIAIARMSGYDPSTIRNWLRKYKIPIRSVSKINLAAIGGCDGLKGLYYANGSSMVRLAEVLGVKPTAIAYRLKRCGIKTRDRGQALHDERGNDVSLTIVANEFLAGELLGDGSIAQQSRFAARYEHGTKHKEYLVWLKELFSEWGVESGAIREHIIKEKSYWEFATHSYPEFLKLRLLWYPDGKKIVPKDFTLSSLSARQWFIGDGSLVYPGRNKAWRPHITICAVGFAVEDIKRLIHDMRVHGVNAVLWKGGTVGMGADATERFFDWVGPCPEKIKPIYGYKWPEGI